MPNTPTPRPAQVAAATYAASLTNEVLAQRIRMAVDPRQFKAEYRAAYIEEAASRLEVGIADPVHDLAEDIVERGVAMAKAVRAHVDEWLNAR